MTTRRKFMKWLGLGAAAPVAVSASEGLGVGAHIEPKINDDVAQTTIILLAGPEFVNPGRQEILLKQRLASLRRTGYINCA